MAAVDGFANSGPGAILPIGLDPGRVKIVWCAASEGEIFARDLKEFIAELKAMGPIGTELEKTKVEAGEGTEKTAEGAGP